MINLLVRLPKVVIMVDPKKGEDMLVSLDVPIVLELFQRIKP